VRPQAVNIPANIGIGPSRLCHIVSGVFTPVLAKHTKSFNLIDTLAVGVDRIQRSFEPMRRQVEEWRQAQVTDERAKLILYSAFVDGKLDAPRSLFSEVHRLYFQPQYEEFSPRTMWSLSNAFTSAFKELEAFHNSRQQPSWGNSWRGGRCLPAAPSQYVMPLCSDDPCG